jgi:hypothetical protein
MVKCRPVFPRVFDPIRQNFYLRHISYIPVKGKHRAYSDHLPDRGGTFFQGSAFGASSAKKVRAPARQYARIPSVYSPSYNIKG